MCVLVTQDLLLFCELLWSISFPMFSHIVLEKLYTFQVITLHRSFNLWLLFPQSAVYLYYLLILFMTLSPLMKKAVLSNLSFSLFLIPASVLFLLVFSFSHLVNKFSSILRVYMQSLTFSSNILFTYTDNSYIPHRDGFIHSVHKGPSTLTFSLWSTILSGF